MTLSAILRAIGKQPTELSPECRDVNFRCFSLFALIFSMVFAMIFALIFTGLGIILPAMQMGVGDGECA